MTRHNYALGFIVKNFTFNTPPSIVFGAGAASQIASIAGRFKARRASIVTDVGLRRAGIVAPIIATLEQAGIECQIFDGVDADPSLSLVLSATAQVRAFDAEIVIGLGGGSSLDVAKLVAVLVHSGQQLVEMFGLNKVSGPRLPLVLIPTTAGTGSEVTPISIVTTGLHEKAGVVSPVLLPDVALLDPELTLSLPPSITAQTGVDAMVHAIEAYTSVSINSNPVSRSNAIEALRLLGGNIRRAVSTGGDLKARSNMLLGSLLAGQAFANSPVAAVHALAYPLGGLYGIPHGLSNSLMLPHVLAFNSEVCEEDYAELEKHIFSEDDYSQVDLAGNNFIHKISRLLNDLGLPRRLRDVGIQEEACPHLAAEAMKQTRLLVNNPRTVSRDDALSIFRAAW